jgi:hypothetical protein
MCKYRGVFEPLLRDMLFYNPIVELSVSRQQRLLVLFPTTSASLHKCMRSYVHRHKNVIILNCHSSSEHPYLSATHTYFSLPPQADIASTILRPHAARFGCAESDDPCWMWNGSASAGKIENVAGVRDKGGTRRAHLESNNESQVRARLRMIRVACRACTSEVFHVVFADTRQTLLISAVKGRING